MKIKKRFYNHIDDKGFGFYFLPNIWIGYENYSYLKVIQIDFQFLMFEYLIELHWK